MRRSFWSEKYNSGSQYWSPHRPDAKVWRRVVQLDVQLIERITGLNGENNEHGQIQNSWREFQNFCEKMPVGDRERRHRQLLGTNTCRRQSGELWSQELKNSAVYKSEQDNWAAKESNCGNGIVHMPSRI